MLNQIELTNFGPLAKVQWDNLGPINLIIGGNGSGKTFLMKACYCAMRTLEAYKRGNDPRTAPEILVEKLRWTFESDKIGDLVSKGKDVEGPLESRIRLDGKDFRYSFGKDTTKQIQSLENHVPPRDNSNSIFLPAKEVLSLHQVILRSRERDQLFGFDDTYLDLARALGDDTTRGKNFQAFARARQMLEDMLGGKVDRDKETGGWHFRQKQGNLKFPIWITSEGIKKIAILDRLLGNRYLDQHSIVFIDEPEAALHPSAISTLMDIISLLADFGIQFFLASHSYFVVKKLYLIAQKQQMSIWAALGNKENQWTYTDLRQGMPDNSIINESIDLYKQEVELTLR
ncbi:MAG: AAA family ATPase [Synechococcus sp. SB0666_bin_14]|nr:AAA family ATPase [Synechococcus sp. SB0666_bin_14]MYG45905.1 AAA family ATPase [Synechococcus sp. SB0675_bin_6]MYJ60416.1 AAA family ATPase [Synechococcus sp. SB0672_bin_6]MYK90647.1 AAA family ATPase [Synechococcus sp. SB0669_bin_8]